MIKINIKNIKKQLIVFMILIFSSLTVPYLLPATFFGSYLLWILLSIGTIIYGIMLIGGLK
jgi:hypothetical protein